MQGSHSELLAAGSHILHQPRIQSCDRLRCMPNEPRLGLTWAANMAAYGEDSSRSALTFMPPVTRTSVSLPDRSVTWTKVSLNEAKMWQTPKTTSPSRMVFASDAVFSSTFLTTFFVACSPHVNIKKRFTRRRRPQRSGGAQAFVVPTIVVREAEFRPPRVLKQNFAFFSLHDTLCIEG